MVKKYKSFIVLVIFVLIYIVIGLIVIPFLGFNFGAKPSLFEKVIGFFVDFPFGYIGKLTKNYFLLMLALNGIFWGCVLAVITYLVKRIF